MVKHFFILILIFTFGIQTEKKNLTIILKNETDSDFKELVINIQGKEFVIYNIKKGKTVKPFNVEKSYDSFYTRVITSKNDTLFCVPEDNIGDEILTSGKLKVKYQYTYEDNHPFLVAESHHNCK